MNQLITENKPILSKEEKINIFMSLFRGRRDVFAQRWEFQNGSKSGYSPVYKDKAKSEYATLNQYFIEEHLRGNRTVGIYPILKENTSWFVAADFDGENWKESVIKVLNKSNEYNLPAYIERSRSGKGAHIWWFFEDTYPAFRGRKVFLKMIKEAGAIDMFDQEESFDRLFPSQDYLSGKGFGNLIALPLQGKSRQSGNSVFLDTINNFEPSVDQWKTLQEVQKIPIKKLNELFDLFIKTSENKIVNYSGKEIPIIISSYISIPKSYIFPELANFLSKNLNFFNTEYVIKQKMGLSVHNIEKFFKTIQSTDETVLIPRGFLQNLTNYFKDHNVPFIIQDNRLKKDLVKLKSTFKLFDYQSEAISTLKDKDFGVLVAPPGSGKTIMGLALIANKEQPALILTHRKQIYNQWIERIEHFLQIKKKNIGQFIAIKKSIKTPITVAMIQTLSKMEDLSELSSQFGLVLVDECHHMPAQMFRSIITKLNPYYLYGLTATPIRKHNDEKLIFIYLGDIVHEVKEPLSKTFIEQSIERKSENTLQVNIAIKETELLFPFKIATKDYHLLSKALIFDTARNQLIVNDVSNAAKSAGKCLVLTERKEHVDILSCYFRKDFEIISLSGDLTDKQKQEKYKQIKSGHFQIIIATGQLIGEGTHFDNLDNLFLVYPFSFKGKLIQYVGRIFHSKENTKTIYDYRDKNIEYLDKMFKKRRKYYDELKGGANI